MQSPELTEFISYVRKMRRAHTKYELHPTSQNFQDYLTQEKIVDYLLLKIDLITGPPPTSNFLVISENWNHAYKVGENILWTVYANKA